MGSVSGDFFANRPNFPYANIYMDLYHEAKDLSREEVWKMTDRCKPRAVQTGYGSKWPCFGAMAVSEAGVVKSEARVAQSMSAGGKQTLAGETRFEPIFFPAFVECYVAL